VKRALSALALLAGCTASQGPDKAPTAPTEDVLDTVIPDGDTPDAPVPENRCPPPDGAIETDAALLDYATCTIIEGSVHIEGPDITELTALGNVAQIEGSLLIGQHTRLTTLDGLESLRRVAGKVVLQNNTDLEDTRALAGLASAGGLIAFGSPHLTHIHSTATVAEVELHSCPTLVEAPGLTVTEDLQFVSLPRLVSWGDLHLEPTVAEVRVHGTGVDSLAPLASVSELALLSVVDAPALVSLAGLDHLTEVPHLTLANAPQLADVDPLAGLTHTRVLTLQGLSGLVDTGGLSGLSTLSKLLLIGEQPDLDLSGLAGLTVVSEQLWIDDSGWLDLSPLSGLGSVGELWVLNSPGITDLGGLSGIVDIDELTITGNHGLESLAGLAGLDTTPHTLQALNISDNAALDELALGGLEAVEDRVIVVLNPRLDACALAERVEAWDPATATMSSNGPCE